ncbi:MAG: 4-demethylwyosine synthase TYW1 [Candidatus Huberarchaeum crystalense]|uniref:S-adenosyl-L-methionine-dependent tRNA 4-demethylwyosine synthase n=1 Tax=Huberarchaeum crystalense TaxID=2014257 RepID=A0A2G9LJD5_HUBC1|nr:4-demethylwyosine synthase TYW1 [archaeon]OIP20812.1 MAG: tRNA-modifying enzyme [archaeon CG2_30_31_98]PIN66635.1 MAG: 4-demethylwyosine synthase TYW1 [Candidatus Huberarchaeum crystalense]NCS98494.1 4-demethylwyosine synthase TYW1 [archaeon]PIV13493.1 MAG: 4-demethylwyosine synthase TYW1 [Candidatus Huberarchaeum crystalense]
MAKIKPANLKIFKRQHYSVVGNHSAVEVCSWTKKSLLNKGVCYKEKFYGIKSHRCIQMTPAVAWCDFACLYCWRSHEYSQGTSMKGNIDDPKTIIDGAIEAQRKQLSGFKGNEKTNLKKWQEAQNPFSFAISLNGEPTLYKKLPEFIRELRARKIISFLVSNGSHPQMLKKLYNSDSLPDQIYISLTAINEKMHKNINCPLVKNSWKRILQTLKLIPNLKEKCRTIIRLTLIKDKNDSNDAAEKFAQLIKLANPNFIEIKSYMFLGYSRKRLKKENQCTHEQVRQFSKTLAGLCGLKVLDEAENSKVCLIGMKKCARFDK